MKRFTRILFTACLIAFSTLLFTHAESNSCNCDPPSSGPVITRINSWQVEISWGASPSNPSVYDYGGYFTNSGTFSGTTPLTSVRVTDNGQGGTVVVRSKCSDGCFSTAIVGDWD